MQPLSPKLRRLLKRLDRRITDRQVDRIEQVAVDAINQQYVLNDPLYAEALAQAEPSAPEGPVLVAARRRPAAPPKLALPLDRIARLIGRAAREEAKPAHRKAPAKQAAKKKAQTKKAQTKNTAAKKTATKAAGRKARRGRPPG
jgi:hypothetical protein